MKTDRHILVISHDVVGAHMAGPGIRYCELARVLAQHFRVTLAAPVVKDVTIADVELWPYQPGVWDSLAPVVSRATTLVLCGDVLAWFPQFMQGETPLVIDGYDPHPLETLALFAGMPEQAQRHQERERILQMQCRAGDFFICAGERQRDWWLGLLEATGRLNAQVYNADPSLRQLIDVVPFGLPASPPQHTRTVLKGVWPGIAPDDKVILWGGGLWQWLDPLTAIRAMARLREQRNDVRLIFPGTRHPNTAIPDMPVVRQARELAADLGLLDSHVFFGDWVPYAEWPNYLLEADAGVSLHFDTVETRLAFRSRVLDYIWAGLPMVLTGGDATADLVQQHGLGQLVDVEDVDGVVQALLDILAQPCVAWEVHFATTRAQLTWERAAEPLVRFCQHPRRIADCSTMVFGEPTATPAIPAAVQTRLEQQEQEIARLRALVDGYERGRFIRLMSYLHGLWQQSIGRLLVQWRRRRWVKHFHQALCHELGTVSDHAFVDRAYWRILRRAPDAAGFKHYTDLLARHQLSRRQVVASLVQSAEFHEALRRMYGIVEQLHLVRCQMIKQLPPAQDVLDLGGAAPNSIQGALLVMGYPHPLKTLTIVDLPPIDRLGTYIYGSDERPGEWIATEVGQIRYLHTRMTDLRAILSCSMDLVFSGQSIEHISVLDAKQVMHEVYRILRPGGHFCLDTPNRALTSIQSPDQLIHPEHQVEYHVSELVALLRETGFIIEKVKGICPMPNTVRTGVFDANEIFAHAYLSDEAEQSYLFYVQCVKPDDREDDRESVN